MSQVVFNLPDLGEGLEDGTVTAWMVAEGDVVNLNQTLCTIETAKAEVEMPSPYAGRIVTLHAAEGETLDVGTPLVTIDASSVGDASGFNDALARAGGDRPAASPAAAAPAPVAAAPVAAVPVAAAPAPGPARAQDAPKRQQVLVGYGAAEESTGGRRRRRRPAHEGLPTAADLAAGIAVTSPPAQGGVAQGGAEPAVAEPAVVEPAVAERVVAGTAVADPAVATQPAARPSALASPPVRLLAHRHGIDLRVVPGSGPCGLVQRADLERFIRTAAPVGSASVAADPAPVAVVAGDGAPSATGGSGFPGPEAARPVPEPLLAGGPRAGEVVPVKGVRAVIAQRMTRSRTEIPEATCSRWVDMTAVVDLRQRLRSVVPDTKLTPFAVLCWLVVDALRREPTMNSTLDTSGAETFIRLHPHVHLGVAVDTPRGLVVANIRHAERRTLGELAAEINRLAVTGRAGKLTPDEMQGSTFTVSNYGAFGLDDGNSIINYPEVAILGVGAVKKRPWVDPATDELVARPTAKLSLAFDHRVADGGHAGRFMTRLADLVAAPERLLLEG